jgi:hypothetical protein
MKKSVLIIFLLLVIHSVAISQRADPRETEVWIPVPEVVIPVGPIKMIPPSDAIVLFDGSNLDEWAASPLDYRTRSREELENRERQGADSEWLISDGVLTVVPGTHNIMTRRHFTDFQLHLEWKTPVIQTSDGQNWGNSGVFLQGRYEVQILNSWENPTYVNGQAGSIYKQHPPLVNASLKPGEWQSYDIIYTAPRFSESGSLESPGRVTVFHNGILIQNNIEILGNTVYRGQPSYKPHGPGPVVLQEHRDEVSFRNIWIREL